MTHVFLPAAPAEAVEALHRRERRPWLQAIGLIAVFVVAEVLSGIFLTENTVEPTASITLVTGALIGAVIVGVGAPLVLKWIAQREPVEFGWAKMGREIGSGLLVGTGLMSIIIGVLAAVGAYRVVDVGWSTGISFAIFAGLVAGFAEELLFRGMLLRLLEKKIGTIWSLVVTSLLFGAIHISNPEASLWGGVSIALEAGILLGACYILTRRLWFAVGVHASWNFVQGGIYGSDISGIGSGRGLFEARFTGPAWLTGGEMGVEASLVCLLVCTIAGLAILSVAYRRGITLSWAQARDISRQPKPEPQIIRGEEQHALAKTEERRGENQTDQRPLG